MSTTYAVPKTLAAQQLELNRLRSESPAGDTPARPRTRGECENVERPCAFASCPYSLILDVHPKTGSVKLNISETDLDSEITPLPDLTCALDIAAEGGVSQDVVAGIFGLTRQAIEVLERRALSKLGSNVELIRSYFP